MDYLTKMATSRKLHLYEPDSTDQHHPLCGHWITPVDWPLGPVSMCWSCYHLANKQNTYTLPLDFSELVMKEEAWRIDNNMPAQPAYVKTNKVDHNKSTYGEDPKRRAALKREKRDRGLDDGTGSTSIVRINKKAAKAMYADREAYLKLGMIPPDDLTNTYEGVENPPNRYRPGRNQPNNDD